MSGHQGKAAVGLQREPPWWAWTGPSMHCPCRVPDMLPPENKAVSPQMTGDKIAMMAGKLFHYTFKVNGIFQKVERVALVHNLTRTIK